MKTPSTLRVPTSTRQNRITGTFRKSGFALFLLSLTFVIWECKKDDFVPTTSVCPIVVFTDPANGDSNVVLSKTLTATFNKVMNPATINNTTFLLRTGSTQLTGVVSINGADATFDPTVNLTANTTYTATITTGAKDPENNAMIADYVWSFRTGDVVNAVPPTVISTDPFNTETNVALNRNVMATFSTVMDINYINNTNFRLSQGANAISGVVTYTGVTATFNPTSDLLPNTLYTATIKGSPNGVRNNAGTLMVADYVWTFTTGSTLDNTPPTVILTDPLDLATNVPLNQIVCATFSEAMNPALINAVNYTLWIGTTPVAGVVNYNPLNNTACFTPTLPLLSNTTYTAKVSQNVTDVAGNPMVADYVWTFTTGLTDNIRPTVISTVPIDQATNVPITQTLTATFSELMDTTSVNATSFLLKEGANTVTGVVGYVSGNTFKFNPTVDLLEKTLYTATIKNTVKDVAGNTMLVDYVWTFTTAGPAGPMAIDLDCAADFAVLAGSTVTNTGLTVVDGDLGLSPGTSVTGFPPGTVINGSIRINDTKANNAKLCLTTAYNDGAGRSQNVITVSDGELGGKTFAPGLYKSGISSFAITSSDMTLDAGGNSNAVWIFQMPSSTFTVGNARKMVLAGGAKASNIFFIVGSSATIGTTAEMYGNILADQSITLKTGASLVGRALTRIAAVTLDFNAVTKP